MASIIDFFADGAMTALSFAFVASFVVLGVFIVIILPLSAITAIKEKIKPRKQQEKKKPHFDFLDCDKVFLGFVLFVCSFFFSIKIPIKDITLAFISENFWGIALSAAWNLGISILGGAMVSNIIYFLLLGVEKICAEYIEFKKSPSDSFLNGRVSKIIIVFFSCCIYAVCIEV